MIGKAGAASRRRAKSIGVYSSAMRALALVLAAGQGVRLGREVPKGLVRLRGLSLLEWSACSLARAPEVAAVLGVVPPGPGAAPPGPPASFAGQPERLARRRRRGRPPGR